MLIGHINKQSPEQLLLGDGSDTRSSGTGSGRDLAMLGIDDDDGVRVLTLNRPEALNAFNDELYHTRAARARGGRARATTSRAS